MPKLKELTKKQYSMKWDQYLDKASKEAKKAGRSFTDVAYWLSSSFSPCNVSINQSTWRTFPPRQIRHFTKIPCDTYCQGELPMATCLVASFDGKFYICRHKVGNCPWKI